MSWRIKTALSVSVDIASKLNVSRASVNRAVGILKEAGFVEQEKYSDIHLTNEGRMAAVSVKERHVALKNFLTRVLGVAPDVAEQDACKMEHSLSKESLEKLKQFMKTQ